VKAAANRSCIVIVPCCVSYTADFGLSVFRRRNAVSDRHLLSRSPRLLLLKTGSFSLAPFPSPPGLSFPSSICFIQKNNKLAIEVETKIFYDERRNEFPFFLTKK